MIFPKGLPIYPTTLLKEASAPAAVVGGRDTPRQKALIRLTFKLHKLEGCAWR
jgi:hypothetical protein